MHKESIYVGSLKNLELPESSDISKVSEFLSTLREDVTQGDDVVFIASNVERADTAFIQLLAAFSADAPSQNISISWQMPSESFVNSVRQLGLENCLKIESTS